MLAPTIHAPGIYFSMPDGEYHADPALGSSSIKALAVDVCEFQFDRLYGEDKDTDALLFGQALHKRILEGRAAFEAMFCTEFDKTTIPDAALDTVAELRGWLSARDIGPIYKLLKPDLIRLIHEVDPSVPIVEVLKAKWVGQTEGKIALKPKRYAQVEIAARWCQEDPLLGTVMDDGAFIEGAPEVSIFYEDRGVRLKARLDRLLRHAIVDLKSFAPIFDDEIHSAALKTINRMHYDIQAADYLRAWSFAKQLWRDGHVFGDEPVQGFLEEAFDREEPKWIWIMVKSTGAPQPLVIEWQARNAKGAAADNVERAIADYIRYRDLYGDDKEWPPRHPAWTVEDQDLFSYFGLR